MLINIFNENETRPPLYFVNLSTRHLQEDIDRPWGLKAISQILVVLEGAGILYCDGHEHALRPGSAVYTAARVPHKYKSLDNMVTAWIAFSGDCSEKILDYFCKLRSKYIDSIDVSKFIATLKAIKAEYNKRNQGSCSALLYSLLNDFFCKEDQDELDSLDEANLFIEHNYQNSITIARLASIARLSRSGFCMRFKERFGCSAIERLLEVRLLNAEQMLKICDNEKIAVISASCGFNDVGYFCKCFKKKFGFTPTEYKRSFK